MAHPRIVSRATTIEQLMALVESMDAQNVPSSARHVVVNPSVYRSLMADLPIAGMSAPRATRGHANGAVGSIWGMDIYIDDTKPSSLS